ncbi:hemerythrin domain-containing protein [Mycolicibacterium sp. F2034L]|uniref:hemerythrin domain-containing protein n=1 Tax=Mycolicibacterium sp. F2034L TaxID=2926422 RepID=UPI001FF25B54|nr:hemerythrin domain-containing protein [Mycolicibacterium sp. F2034L]MCK0176059.1 hemerythrin domain-containing protein [Mycolicibacterium sp. F2034L]
MGTSLADQTADDLGGPHSVLTRQKRDHVELDRLLHRIDESDGATRQDHLTQLCRLVFPHAFAEESVLWPAIRKWVPQGEPLTLEIEREHQEINELFTELEKLPPDDPEHRRLWERIKSLLREDVRDEEDRLLPMLQDALDRDTLVRLGWAWEAVRRISPDPAASGRGATAAGQRRGGRTADSARPRPRSTGPGGTPVDRTDGRATGLGQRGPRAGGRRHRTRAAAHPRRGPEHPARPERAGSGLIGSRGALVLGVAHPLRRRRRIPGARRGNLLAGLALVGLVGVLRRLW